VDNFQVYVWTVPDHVLVAKVPTDNGRFAVTVAPGRYRPSL
jgi:hypothetical protein